MDYIILCNIINLLNESKNSVLFIQYQYNKTELLRYTVTFKLTRSDSIKFNSIKSDCPNNHLKPQTAGQRGDRAGEEDSLE